MGDDSWYTIRKVQHNEWEVCKWLFGSVEPESAYKVYAPRWACTCPSYKVPCKHADLVKEAIAGGKMDKSWMWSWSPSSGWMEHKDLNVEIMVSLLDTNASDGKSQ